MAAYPTNLDLDVLRTFVLGIELGSFAKAAERVARSPSAVSTQLKKLEQQMGVSLVQKAGRNLILTEAGEQLAGYARRLIELNDEAVAALQAGTVAGTVRLGLQEDFAEVVLPGALGRFTRTHPNLRIEARVARNHELKERIVDGTLDLALMWSDGTALPYAELLAELPLVWIGSQKDEPCHAASQLPLPLVTFEAPCLFRTVGTTALDMAGIPWWIGFTSPSLSGLWAATAAGLGVMVRTPLGLPATVRVLAPKTAKLPELPTITLVMCTAEARPSKAVTQLATVLREVVASL